MKYSPNRTNNDVDYNLLHKIIVRVTNAEELSVALLRNSYCYNISINTLRNLVHKEIDSAIDMFEKLETIYPVMNNGKNIVYSTENTDGLLKEVNDMISQYNNKEQ